MRWLDRHTMSVLVLDGSERFTSFPRLTVIRTGGGWAACVIAGAGARTTLPGTYASDRDAKAACVQAARAVLPRRWHSVLDGALADLGAAADDDPTSGVVLAPAPVRNQARGAFARLLGRGRRGGG